LLYTTPVKEKKMKKFIPILVASALGLGACAGQSKPPTSPAFQNVPATVPKN
jgi:hypothetical protein